ncbi:MAG: DUF2231 domain-containing protein [Gemmatimonadales bacterium]
MLGYDWTRLHALLNDLPAALLVTAVFFDLVGLATRRVTFRQVGFWTMMAGVLGAGLAVLSGLQAEEYIAHGEAVHRVMETHERLGLISLGVFAVLILWRIVREGRMGGVERSLSTIVSLGGVGVVVATGIYGGRLVFDHAAGIPSEVLEAELRERAQEHHHRGEEGDQVATPQDSSPAALPADRVDSAGPPQPPHTHSDPPGTPPHTH